MLWHFSCPFQYCGCETNWKASSNRKAWHHLSKPSSSLSSSGWHWSPLIPEAAQSSARRPASQRETRRMCRWLVFLLTFPGCRCVLPVVCHRPACRHHPGHLHDRTDCRCVTVVWHWAHQPILGVELLSFCTPQAHFTLFSLSAVPCAPPLLSAYSTRKMEKECIQIFIHTDTISYMQTRRAKMCSQMPRQYSFFAFSCV